MAIGNPISLTDNVASKIIRVIATNNQTVFTVDGGYRINQIAVFRNGVRLSNNSDFTAVDGVTVTIVNPTLEGDEVLFEIIDDFKVANAIVSTASTQTIFGNLSINGELHVSSISAGILTTGGDGSQLSGVVNSVIAGDNILVSSATGNVTITGLAKTDNINADSLVVTGVSTLGVVTGATYYGDGSNLTGLPAVTVSETPPTLPTAGDLWWDSSDTVGTLFVWYEDGDSDQWVEASPSGNDNLYWNRIGTNLSPVNLGDSIGIGTDNPSEKLEINSGSGNTPLKLVSTGSSVYINFEDDSTSSANRIGAISNDLVFHTNNTERLRITSAGITSVTGSLAVNGNNYPTTGSLGNRNIIINGANEVDQRGSGSVAITTLTDGKYITDRWIVRAESNTTGQSSQSGVAPDDFTNSLLVEVGATAVPRIASDNRFIRQNVEGYNLRRLKWGTASAKSATISFWVRSSLTGTYSFSFFSGLVDQHYVTNYTISAADTWEYKTITVPGPTSGTFVTDSGLAVYCHWDLGSGSSHQTSALNNWYSGDSRASTTGVDFFNTANANFRLTGVQLEVGTKATPFEHRSYGTELSLCQRYFIAYRNDSGISGLRFITGGYGDGSSRMRFSKDLPTTMRVAPTVSFSGNWQIQSSGSGFVDTTVSASVCTKNTLSLFASRNDVGATGALLYKDSTAVAYTDAEL